MLVLIDLLLLYIGLAGLLCITMAAIFGGLYLIDYLMGMYD